MDSQSEPRDESYDTVVVGSGIGGVTAAALLAKAGRKVLVVERLDGPGGYARAFRRGPYVFDPAIHVSGQGKEGQIFQSLLAYLDIADSCTLLPVDPFYAAAFPNARVALPEGVEAFVEAHVQQFPHEADGIRRFFHLCNQIQHDIHSLPMQLSLEDLEVAAARFPILFKYLRATTGEVLDDCLTDRCAKGLCTTPWPYLGLPPSKLSFLTFCGMLISLIDSAWYCRGSFQQLVDALVVALKRNGGELVVGQRVSRILVEDGRVTGVTLQNGRHIRATAVVSNVDARQTFEDLVGAEHLPQQFLRRLRRLKISLSACVVFAATKANLTEFHPAHETFIYKHWDHDATYQDILDGKPGGMWIDIPTHLDPSLAPPGEHLAIITSLAQYDLGVPWEQERARFEEQLLSETEILFPGFRDQLTFVETATPLTLERYTLNHQGAIYGWDYSTSQIGSRRPDHQTPITGLYLSGHWTQPGATSLRVLSSGIHTAQLILRNPKLGELSPTFEHADLPSV